MSNSRESSEDNSLRTSSSFSNSKSTSFTAQSRSSSSTPDSFTRRAASSRSSSSSNSSRRIVSRSSPNRNTTRNFPPTSASRSRSTSPSTHSSHAIPSASSPAVQQRASPASFSSPLRMNSVENAPVTFQHGGKPRDSSDKGDTAAEESTLGGGTTRMPDKKEHEKGAVGKELPQREGTALHMVAPLQVVSPSTSIGRTVEEKNGAPPSRQTAVNGNASPFFASSIRTSSGDPHGVTPHPTRLHGARNAEEGIVENSIERRAIFTEIDNQVEELLPRPSTPSSFSGNSESDSALQSHMWSNSNVSSTSYLNGAGSSSSPTRLSDRRSSRSRHVAPESPRLGSTSAFYTDATSSSKGDTTEREGKAPARSLPLEADPFRKSTLAAPPSPLPVPSTIQLPHPTPAVVPPSSRMLSVTTSPVSASQGTGQSSPPAPPPRRAAHVEEEGHANDGGAPPPPLVPSPAVTFLEPTKADDGALGGMEAKAEEEEEPSETTPKQEDTWSSTPREYEDDYEEEDEEEAEKTDWKPPHGGSMVSNPHRPNGSHSTEDNADEESSYGDAFFSERRRRAACASQSSAFQRLGNFVAFGEASSKRDSATFSIKSNGETHSAFTSRVSADSAALRLDGQAAEWRANPKGSPSHAWLGEKLSSNKEEKMEGHHTSAALGTSSSPLVVIRSPFTEDPQGKNGGPTRVEGEGGEGKAGERTPISTTPTTSVSPTGKAKKVEETDDSSSVFSTVSQHLAATPATARLASGAGVTHVPPAMQTPRTPQSSVARSHESSNFSSVSAREHRPQVSTKPMAWVIGDSDGARWTTGVTEGGAALPPSGSSDAASPSSSSFVLPSRNTIPASVESSPFHTADTKGVVGRTPPTLTAAATTVSTPSAATGQTSSTSSPFATTAPSPTTTASNLTPSLYSILGKAASSLSSPTTMIGGGGALSNVPLPKPSFWKTEEASQTDTAAAAPQGDQHAPQQQREWRLEELRETSKAVERLVGAFAGLKVGYFPAVQKEAPGRALQGAAGGTADSSSTPPPPPPPPPPRRVVEHQAQTSMHKVGAWGTQKTFPLPSRRPYASLASRTEMVGVSEDLLATPMSVLHPSYGWRRAAVANPAIHATASPFTDAERLQQGPVPHQMKSPLPSPCRDIGSETTEKVVEEMIRDVVVGMWVDRQKRKDTAHGGRSASPSSGLLSRVPGKDGDGVHRSLRSHPHEFVSSDDFRMDGRHGGRVGAGCAPLPHRLHSSHLPPQRGTAASYSGRERLPPYGKGGSRAHRPLGVADNALQAFSLFSGTPDDDADADHALQEAVQIALEKYFWSRVLPSCSASPSTFLPPPSSVVSPPRIAQRTRWTTQTMRPENERAPPHDAENANRSVAMSCSLSSSSPLASLAPLISPYVAWTMLLDIIGVCRDIIEYSLLLDRRGEAYYSTLSGRTTDGDEEDHHHRHSPPVSCSFFGFPMLVQFTGPASMEELARATMHCLPFEALNPASSAASPLYTAQLHEEGSTRLATCTTSSHTQDRSVFRLEYWVSRERLFSVIEAVESSLRTHLVRDAQGVPLLLLQHAHARPHGASSSSSSYAAAMKTPALVLEAEEREGGGGGGTLEESLCMPNGVIPTQASYFMVVPPSFSRTPRQVQEPSRQRPDSTDDGSGGTLLPSSREEENISPVLHGVRDDPPLLPRQGREWKRKTQHFFEEAEKEEREHLFGIGEDAVERISHVVSCLATDILTQSEVHPPHAVALPASTGNTRPAAHSPSLAYSTEGRKEETLGGEPSSSDTLPSTSSPPLMHLEKASDFPLLCRIVAETTADLFEDVQVRRALERRAAEKLKEHYALKGTYATSSRLHKEKMWIQKAEEEANHTVNRILQEIRAQKVAEYRAVYAA